MVFADSRNWAADQQIILELLLSVNGVMGTQSKLLMKVHKFILLIPISFGQPIINCQDMVWVHYKFQLLHCIVNILVKN